MPPEVYKPIPGYSLYEVSDYGNVRSWRNNANGKREQPKRLRPGKGKSGYLGVVLIQDGKRVNHNIHRLVLSVFIGDPEQGHEGCHNDGNRENNRLDNLRWDTRKSNHADKKAHGTHQAGERIGNSKLTAMDVLAIRGLRVAGHGVLALSDMFGVAHQTISRIANRRIWKHI